jgi:ketosteroid isomerase-like protein
MPNEEVVRHSLRTREGAGRTLDQRLATRSPRFAHVLMRPVLGLPPSSRIRQATLVRAAEIAFAAYNRRDLDAITAGFHPEIEYYPYRQFVEAGLAEPVYHGPEGYRRYVEATYDVWGPEGVKLEPTEVIDAGDRLVLLADMPMRAQGSGVTLTEKYGSVWWLRDGLVGRVDDFLDQAEALRAGGVG